MPPPSRERSRSSLPGITFSLVLHLPLYLRSYRLKAGKIIDGEDIDGEKNSLGCRMA